MENASKALIMAAGVLIGVMILTLWVYLFLSFGAQSEDIYNKMEEQQLVEYNAQYTLYSGRNDVTIYDIISVANLAYENNKKYLDYTNFDSEYQVMVMFNGKDIASTTLTDRNRLLQDYLEAAGNVDSNGVTTKFTGVINENDYHENGRIKKISFQS